MTINLPEPIAAFVAGENAGDPLAAVRYFADTAVVHDEGQTHTGIAAITLWKAKTAEAYQITMLPLAVTERDGKTVVTSRVSGAFPGSPADLEFAFGLAGGRIVSLDIS
jgi:hypothetical protein